MLFNFMQRVHKMLPTVHNESRESTATTSPAVCCDSSVCSGRMLRAWRGRRLSWAWLVGVVQLLLALHRLVERLDEQSAARSGVPASSAHVDDERLDDDLVQSSQRERKQQLHAEVLVVRCRRLHHLVAWILLPNTPRLSYTHPVLQVQRSAIPARLHTLETTPPLLG